MKTPIAIALVLLGLYACNGKKETLPVDTDTVQQLFPNPPDTVRVTMDMHYSWEAVPDDNSNRLIMKRVHPIPNDSLTAVNIIAEMNSRYDRIRLRLGRISNDTIYVKVIPAGYLTQQMGSSGADIYMTEATYNLTELKNIGYVNFDFTAGDHAAPGTYSRSDFVNILFSSH